MVTSYRAQFPMMTLQLWFSSMLTSEATSVGVGDHGHGHIGFVRVHFSVEFCGDDSGGHGRNGHLFCGTNRVHLGVCKFHLSGINIVDQLVAVHEVNDDDVVVQFGDHVHRVCKFLSFDPQVYFVDHDGVHCVPWVGDAALSIGDFLQFLHSKCSIKWSAVHACNGGSSIK